VQNGNFIQSGGFNMTASSFNRVKSLNTTKAAQQVGAWASYGVAAGQQDATKKEKPKKIEITTIDNYYDKLNID
jgi:hypothetical protein